MSKKEKATREYLETLSKDRVIELCLQFMFDANIAEKQLDQLEQQLAEKEQEFFVFQEDSARSEQIYIRELEKKQNTIDEINKEFVQAVHDWKALCAKKDKEIERLLHYNNKLAQGIYWGNGEQFVDVVKKLKQNQTQLAIQELEKVKEKIDCEMAIREYDISEQTADVCVSIAEQIDQQIKELKGEKEVED